MMRFRGNLKTFVTILNSKDNDSVEAWCSAGTWYLCCPYTFSPFQCINTVELCNPISFPTHPWSLEYSSQKNNMLDRLFLSNSGPSKFQFHSMKHALLYSQARPSAAIRDMSPVKCVGCCVRCQRHEYLTNPFMWKQFK